MSRRTEKRWLVLWLLFAAVLVNYIDRSNLSLAAVAMMKELRVTPAAMGTLLSSFFWTYAVMQVPAGYVVDRYGLKWTYTFGFLLWSLASAAVAFSGSFYQVLSMRLLLGLGEAVMAPASLAYIRTRFREEERGLPTGVYVSGMMVGPALGALLGSFILARMGWRSLFLVTGMGGCVWLLPWIILVPAHREGHSRPVKLSTAETPRARIRGRDWLRLFGMPTTWGITIGAFFYSYYWYFLLTWLPSYLLMEHSFSALRMGAFTAAPLFGMAAISPVGGRMADWLGVRLGRPLAVRKGFTGAGFLMGSAIVFLLAVRSQAAILAILLVSLTGLGMATANYWAITQALSPASIVGRVIGYQNTVASVGGIVSPALTGLLVARHNDFAYSILLAGGALLVAALALLILVRQADAPALQRLAASEQ